MNRYTLITIAALLVLIILLPVYAWLEPARLANAQGDLRQQFVSDAAVLYVENCAVCHGAAGEGLGSTPALANSALSTADYDLLYKTIARGRYGTTMSGWHQEEGGILNDYQIEELVALIRYADWPQVGELAAAQGLIPPSLPVPQTDEAFLADVAALSPEGAAWAEGMGLYATNCTICHGIDGQGSDLAVPLNTAEVRAKEAAELARIITEGVPGTLMAGWDKVLDPQAIKSLVAFLKNWDAVENAGLALTPPEPIHIDLNNPQEVLALGERIYSTTCAACHGAEGEGGIGPALNSQQILTRNSDEQLQATIINGGLRPNSSMPAFGDRMTSVEIDAVVSFLRAWEPDAPWVQNPRGTAQGGGPPWLRATPDPANPISPNQGQGSGGGPPWRQNPNTGDTSVQSGTTQPTPTLAISGQVLAVSENSVKIAADDGTDVDAMLGPTWYWSANGILLKPGDAVEFEGFKSAGHIEVNWLHNLTTGERIELRSAAGIPAWSGGGG